jgi:hypothetical protein
MIPLFPQNALANHGTLHLLQLVDIPMAPMAAFDFIIVEDLCPNLGRFHAKLACIRNRLPDSNFSPSDCVLLTLKWHI